MTNVTITKANKATAIAAIKAADNLDTAVRSAIAAYAKLGKVLKRIEAAVTDKNGKRNNAAFDTALVQLGLRDAKAGKADKRSSVQRDLFSRDNRSLCVKLADNLPAANAFLKAQAKAGGKVSTMSGVLSKIAAKHRKPKAAANVIKAAGENVPAYTDDAFYAAGHYAAWQKLADKFYNDCRAMGVSSVDALALLERYDDEKHVNADLKMAQAKAA